MPERSSDTSTVSDFGGGGLTGRETAVIAMIRNPVVMTLTLVLARSP
jgi:hypothetical protein